MDSNPIYDYNNNDENRSQSSLDLGGGREGGGSV